MLPVLKCVCNENLLFGFSKIAEELVRYGRGSLQGGIGKAGVTLDHLRRVVCEQLLQSIQINFAGQGQRAKACPRPCRGRKSSGNPALLHGGGHRFKSCTATENKGRTKIFYMARWAEGVGSI